MKKEKIFLKKNYKKDGTVNQKINIMQWSSAVAISNLFDSN